MGKAAFPDRRQGGSRAVRMWLLNLAGLLALLSGVAAPMLKSVTHEVMHPTAAAAALTPTVLATGPRAPGVTPTSPAAPAATPTAALPVARPVHQSLVVLGDSVPAGDACDCGGFATDLAMANGPAALTNASQDGLTSAGLLAQLDSPSLDTALASATVVTVTIGANDFDEALATGATCADASCYRTTLASMTSTVNEIITRLVALTRPATTVVLTGYWNVFLDGAVGASHGATYVASSDALSRAVNAAIATIASGQHVLYADLYAPFKGDGSVDDTGLLAADGDHPNAAGHRLIAMAIATAANLVSL